MNKEELFANLTNPPRADAQGSAARQISPLGTYVLGELPADLAAVSQGRMTYGELAEKQCRVLERLGPEAFPVEALATARVVQLDLLFMLGGFLPAGPEAFPRPLVDAISAQCVRFPSLDPHMSYELLIDVNVDEWNRHGEIRVFSEGELGRLERDFYVGHRLSEPSVGAAFDRLRTLILEPDTTVTAEALQDAHRSLDEFRLHMAQYGRLPKEAFDSFRRYHMGYPGGPRGASGAFMPSVQLLELALLPPTEEYGTYLDQSMVYFPTWSRPLVAEWRERSSKGENVVDAVLDGRLKLDDSATTALLAVIDRFADFRMVHLGVTRKAIPEAFSDGERLTRRDIAAQAGERDILSEENPGTSGFDVRNVLTNAVYRLLAARRQIESLTPITG